MRRASEDTKYIVYLHKNRYTGLGYVGVTSGTAEKRWKQHVAHALSGKGNGGSLHGAIRSHGEDAFDHHVLEKNVTSSEVAEAEKWWILEEGTLYPYGYNLCEGGDGGCGYVRTSEEKSNISKKAKERWGNPLFREAVSAKLRERFQDPVLREQRSEALKERWDDPEFRRTMTTKIKDRCQDPSFCEGVSKRVKEEWDSTRRYKASQKMKDRWSDESYREEMSAKSKEMWGDPECRVMILSALRAQKNTTESREKTSARNKEMWRDPEYRSSLSAKIKAYHNKPETKVTMSARSKDNWQKQEYREMMRSSKIVLGPLKGRYKGVSWTSREGKWTAKLSVCGKVVLFLQFQSEEEAARAYDAAARIHLGKGAFLNFPTDQERADWLELKASLESKRKSK